MPESGWTRQLLEFGVGGFENRKNCGREKLGANRMRGGRRLNDGS
jgi:hypothetical protein